jgi:hypothetical protein
MYTTIKADIENGRVRSSELQKLPASAHVLITLLHEGTEKKQYNFSALSGRLKWKGQAVEEQRKLRDEW